MSDLAEQILAVITTVELTGRLGDPPLGFILDGREHHPDDVEIVYETGRGERDAVLRRCAADREIVKLYVKVRDAEVNLEQRRTWSDHERKDWEHANEVLPYLTAVVTALARGYGIQP